MFDWTKDDAKTVRDAGENLREHLEQIAKSGRPLAIAEGKEVKGVLLSPALYAKLADAAAVLESVRVLPKTMEELEAAPAMTAEEQSEKLAVIKRRLQAEIDAQKAEAEAERAEAQPA